MTDIAVVGQEYEWSLAEKLLLAGESEKLAGLLRTGEEIPSSTRELLADLINGKVAFAQKRGKSNALLTYEERENIFRAMRSMKWRHADVRRNAEGIADRWGCEVAEVLNWLSQERRATIAALAKAYGVSESSIPTIASRFKPMFGTPPVPRRPPSRSRKRQ